MPRWTGHRLAPFDPPRAKRRGADPLEAYYRLWSSDLPEDVFIWDDQPADTDGGYFHVISVGLGRRFHRFSAQNRTNFLGMGTSTISARLDVANAITRLIADHVPTQPLPEEPAVGDEEKPGKTTEDADGR